MFYSTLNRFDLWLYGIGHMVKKNLDCKKEETHCCHMGYSFQLAARDLLYAPSHYLNRYNCIISVYDHYRS